jgi:hypothetical protein
MKPVPTQGDAKPPPPDESPKAGKCGEGARSALEQFIIQEKARVGQREAPSQPPAPTS